MLPAPSPAATAVKYAKVSGSIPTDAMRGTISRTNSRKVVVRKCIAGRILKLVRVVPIARSTRCAPAPATAPQAVAAIPNLDENRTVPRMIPVVYRIGANA